MTNKMFLADSNNLTEVKDSFGVHTKIVETIVEIAKQENLTDFPFNLGLFGSWGSGKSYIINNIIRKLEEQYAVFNIDVWKYVGHPLMRSILFDIDKQLKDTKIGIYNEGYIDKNDNSLEKMLYADTDFEEEVNLKWDEISNKLKPIVRKLLWAAIVIGVFSAVCHFCGNAWLKTLSIPVFSGLGFISAPLILVHFFEKQIKDFTKTLFCNKKIKTYTYKPTFSPEQFEKIFSDIVTNISKNGKKVLIVFDNLDRCEPKYAYETLSAIKTFMDKENCLFLIPCDDVAIKKYISSNYNFTDKNDEKFSQVIGEEFFDKLFNTYIRIPQLQEIDRDIFIEEQLKNLSVYPNIEKNINEIKQILFYGYKGSTPRQIKRFINDFSINYMLANNIDPEHKFLLNNLTLFAIMIVIKQKWSNIEEILTKDPDLFSKSIKDDDYKLFISRIKNMLPNKIPSILPFIYLKETVDAKSISSILKDGYSIDLIDDSVTNRIKTEIQQMAEKEEFSYLQNAALVIFNSINDEKLSTKNKNSLIKILGDIISLENINFVDFIENISNDLDRLFSYIPIMREKQSFAIKQLLSKYLRLNSYDDELSDKHKLNNELKLLIFEKITNKPDVIEENYISSIFTDFDNISQIDESIQKYVEILNNKNKLSLIPESFVNYVINTISKDSFSENAINCLKHYNKVKLTKISKEMLARKINEIITAIYSSVSSYTNQLSLLNGIKLSLNLFDKDAFNEKDLINFNTVLQHFIKNLFNYNVKLSIELLVASSLFVTKESDSEYESLLRSRLSSRDSQNEFVKGLRDNNYIQQAQNLISCERTKSFLFGIPEIKKQIYMLLRDSINNFYKQLLREEDLSMEDLKILFEVIREQKIDINQDEFKDFIFSKYYNEENLERTFSLFEILNENNIKIFEKDFAPIKNRTIDAYKQDVKSGTRYLQIASEILTNKQFNKLFIKPIYSYIRKELEATESVAVYSSIASFVNSEFILSETNSLKEFIIMLLEDNQERAEYELACNIISKFQENSIDISEFQEMVSKRIAYLNNDLQVKINEIYKN